MKKNIQGSKHTHPNYRIMQKKTKKSKKKKDNP